MWHSFGREACAWLEDRLSCGKRLNNVMLQEGLKTVEAMRSDLDWQAARAMRDKTARCNAFDAAKKKHNFHSAHFDALVAKHAKAASFTGRIGSHEQQAIAKRVFESLADWVHGLHGRPRFKGYNRPLHSVKGKNNTGMLQWKPDAKVLQVQKGWAIAPILPKLDKDEWLWSALQQRTKYCRIVWRNIHGQQRWFVQLIQERAVPVKASLLAKLAPEGLVGGLDLGPSNIRLRDGKRRRHPAPGTQRRSAGAADSSLAAGN